MSIEPESLSTELHSPLRGFDFTRDWLMEKEFPRSYLPGSDALVRKRLAALEDKAWKPWTASEIQELKEFNLAAGNSDGAKLAETLSRDDALVVVTGQQPDFLASPLYVLHKALSACAWAKRLAGELDRPIIPVFWVASDDDDFAELKQAWMVSFSGELFDTGARLSRGRGLNAGSPAYLWNLSEAATRVKQDITRALKGWPGGHDTAAWLASEIDACPDFETLFCRLLTRLLGPEFPMLFVAPRLKTLREKQVEILSKDVQCHDRLNKAISQTADTFRGAGYSVTLQRDAKSLNFFWLHKQRRHRLMQIENEIRAIDPHNHAESARFSQQELLAHLKESPEDFAPNVVTRPVVQDMALPTVAYVAGPGELAYLAVLGKAYDEFQCTRSAVIPRTLITMDPQGVLLEWTGGKPPEKLADAVLLRGSGTSDMLLRQLSDLMADTTQNLERIRTSMAGRKSEVRAALDKTERHFLHGVEQLKRRLARQLAPDEWNRAARMAAMMAPAGATQERVLAPWNFIKLNDWDALARYLAESADYTADSPQTALLPPWMREPE